MSEMSLGKGGRKPGNARKEKQVRRGGKLRTGPNNRRGMSERERVAEGRRIGREARITDRLSPRPLRFFLSRTRQITRFITKVRPQRLAGHQPFFFVFLPSVLFKKEEGKGKKNKQTNKNKFRLVRTTDRPSEKSAAKLDRKRTR